MKDEFSKTFFRWVEEERLRVPDVAADLNKEAQTVYNWRSKGVPKSQRVACQSLMDKSREEKFESIRSTLVLKPTHDQLNEWNKAALTVGKTIEDWAFEGLEEMADDFFSKRNPEEVPENVTSIVAEPESEYRSNLKEYRFVGCCAAGEPVEAERDDILHIASNLDPNRYVIYEVNGQSAEPLFEDGDRLFVEIFPGEARTARKGVPAIFRDADGCYLKKFVGIGKPLESINPDADDLIPSDDMQLVGYPHSKVED